MLRNADGQMGSDPYDFQFIVGLLIQSRGKKDNSSYTNCVKVCGPSIECVFVNGWSEKTCGKCNLGENASGKRACSHNQTTKADQAFHKQMGKEKRKLKEERGRESVGSVSLPQYPDNHIVWCSKNCGGLLAVSLGLVTRTSEATN